MRLTASDISNGGRRHHRVESASAVIQLSAIGPNVIQHGTLIAICRVRVRHIATHQVRVRGHLLHVDRNGFGSSGLSQRVPISLVDRNPAL